MIVDRAHSDIQAKSKLNQRQAVEKVYLYNLMLNLTVITKSVVVFLLQFASFGLHTKNHGTITRWFKVATTPCSTLEIVFWEHH